MKSNRKYRNLIIATIVIAATGQSIARAQGAPVIAPAAASTAAAPLDDSLPLSDQRHWEGFLKLAAKPNAVVTVKDLEDAFGQKAVYLKKNGLYDSYSIKDFVTLLPSEDRFAKERYPERASNYVSFGFLGRHNKMCITRDQVISDLLNFGWILHAHSPAEGDLTEDMPDDMKVGSDIFLKADQGVLRLIYSITNCATTAIMQSNKLAFDEAIQANKPGIGQ
ncbi:hypothetical protein [Dyella subtropica]|uniref:hypothetical protein n=1 Tax=Dyella subtropica TaxID=2992127 RepID=UPI002252ADCD|nr:hypothetical protein [Dyella subtropica]